MRTTRPCVLPCSILWAILAGLQTGHPETASTNPPSATVSIPYVPTRHDTVRDLLWLADVGTNNVVYDLGSGDGRVVIAAVSQFGARGAVGIEIDRQLVERSRQAAAKAGVADRVQFIQGDLFTNDLSRATVAVLYLGHAPNLELRAHLIRSLKPGARVVSHQFGMGEWPADKSLDVRTALLGMYSEWHNPFASNSEVPDFSTPFLRMNHDVLSVWVVPAPVAGTWQGALRLDGEEEGDLRLTLHQRLSGLNGSFDFRGTTNLAGVIQADLWGTHLRLHCIPTNGPYGRFLMWFEGHASGDALKGALWISRNNTTRTLDWTGRRVKTDFAGIWEWPGPRDTPVQLKIERREGRLAVTFTDTNREVPGYSSEQQPIPVSDFYDFGAGFYFTLLLGRDGGSRRMGPDDGWLIGEATATDNSLLGTIAFYPYPGDHFSRTHHIALPNAAPPLSETPSRKTGKRPWHAKRLNSR